MARLVELQGDVFSDDRGVLVHQCNSVTTKGAHLSGQVFRRYPYADVYARRRATNSRDEPGTVILVENERRTIANLIAQRYPGKSRFGNDTYPQRISWFRSCLNGLAEWVRGTPTVDLLVIPHGIGCGAAGGDWNAYKAEIESFVLALPETVRVEIRRLE